jgi:predicted metal-binding protein
MNFFFLHKTPTTDIRIQLSLKVINAPALSQYEDKRYFSNLCENGCVNYNKKWSCPPYSPAYQAYSQNYEYCLLTLFSCDLSQFIYVKTEYMKVKTSNSILKSQSDKLSRFLEDDLSGKMLSNGSCRLCKPCSKKVSADSCKNPLKLRYSLESLGLNVEKISQVFFNHQLLWYTSKVSPNYATVVSGILANTTLEQYQLLEIIKRYCSANNIFLVK